MPFWGEGGIKVRFTEAMGFCCNPVDFCVDTFNHSRLFLNGKLQREGDKLNEIRTKQRWATWTEGRIMPWAILG